MMPLYINGRLLESEKNDFESALMKYPELVPELMEFAEIKGGYADLKREIQTLSNDLYERILNNIGKKEKTESMQVENQRVLDPILRKLRKAFTAPQLSWSVVAVQLVIIIALFVIFPKSNNFKTLSEIPVAKDDSGMINVVFNEDAKEKNIRELLEQINGSIISGPTPDGLYIVKIKNIDDVETVLNKLKDSSIIRLAVKRY
jgi:hypothetical protein